MKGLTASYGVSRARYSQVLMSTCRSYKLTSTCVLTGIISASESSRGTILVRMDGNVRRVQKMIFPADHPEHPGQPKGMKVVLQASVFLQQQLHNVEVTILRSDNEAGKPVPVWYSHNQHRKWPLG